MTKRCSKCEESKPISQFGYNRANRDGRSTYCIDCTRLMAAERRKEQKPIEPAKMKLCKRCGYQWPPRSDKPLSCPRCHSAKWNQEVGTD